MGSVSGILRHEHESIEHLLQAMEGMGGAMERGQPVPKADVDAALDAAASFADRCHHAKEESVLFPALLEAIPQSERIVRELEGDHKAARKLVASMREGREFPRNARLYARILRVHILHEDEELLPMADRLPPRYQDALADAFERVEHEEMGEGAHERLEEAIRGLHARWGSPQTSPGA